MAMHFTQIRIINIKNRLEKIINIEDYDIRSLNAIIAFYENHKEYTLERI